VSKTANLNVLKTRKPVSFCTYTIDNSLSMWLVYLPWFYFRQTGTSQPLDTVQPVFDFTGFWNNSSYQNRDFAIFL